MHPRLAIRNIQLQSSPPLAPDVLLSHEDVPLDKDDLMGYGSGVQRHQKKRRNNELSIDEEISSNDNASPLKKTLLSLSPEELVDLVGGTGRAKMIWKALSVGEDPSVEPSAEDVAAGGGGSLLLGKPTRDILRNHLRQLPPVVHSVASADGTRKMLIRLEDGLEVEAVLIPMTGSIKPDHNHNLATADDESSGGEGTDTSKSAEDWQRNAAENINSAEFTEIADVSQLSSRAEQQQQQPQRAKKTTKKKQKHDLGHTTLCISSQVGCARGCTFCATGKMGLVRCLTTEEILAQCFHGRREALAAGLPPLNNVVFMGMGEPLNNPKAVGEALKRLTHDQLGFGFSKTRVTVSTVAPSPEAVLKAATVVMPDAMLAWSVHAADDATRKLLVPTTRHTMVELREAFRSALRARPSKSLRTLMVEVALMDGLNDSTEHATRLAAFLKPMIEEDKLKVCVNLIPFNPVEHQPFFRRPSREAVASFQQALRERGVFTFVRTTHGDEESSACGQLATLSKQQQEGGADI